MKKRRLSTLLLVASTIVVSAQTDYYVSPTGKSTNDGLSPETPFNLVSKAINKVEPGSTVYIMPGEYKSAVTISKDHSGTEDGYITFKAYDMNDRPRFYVGGSGKWNCLDIQASYIIIDGLELEGYNQSFSEQDSIAAADCVTASSVPNEAARYNTNGISIGKGGKNGGFPHHVIVRNCIVHDFPGGGVGCQQGDYITFENNTIYNNAWYTMYACSGISILNPINTDENTDDYKLVIRNNVVYNNHTKIKWRTGNIRYSDGNGIIIDVNMSPDGSTTDEIKADGAYRGKTLVANNVSYFNGGSGIHAFKAANVDIINNTTYHNEQRYKGEYGEIFSQSGKNNNIVNNVMYARANHKCNNYVSNGGGTYTNNIYCGGTYTMTTSNLFVNASKEPMFVKVPEVFGDDADLRLAAGSKAIGFGTYKDYMPETDITGADRNASSIDCGAYVYESSTSVSAHPLTPLPHNGTAYNIQGQRVGDEYRGLVIVNGRKRFVKTR